MSEVIINGNQPPQVANVANIFPTGVPGIGFSEYDSDLVFGGNAFSVVGILNSPALTNYLVTSPCFNGAPIGTPLFNFVDISLNSAITATADLAKTNTSATLTGNWTGDTGVYSVLLSSGEVKNMTLTNGATTCTWSGGLVNPALAAMTVLKSPYNGWGLWTMGTNLNVAFRYFNACTGVAAATTTFREVQAHLNGNNTNGNKYGLWNLFGFGKPANSSAVINSVNGAADVGPSSTGSATAMGIPSFVKGTATDLFPAKVRYFHSVRSSYDATLKIQNNVVNNLFDGGLGLWIFNTNIGQTDLDTATGSVSGLQTIVSKYITSGNLVARTFSGVGDWTSLSVGGTTAVTNTPGQRSKNRF